MLMYTDAYAIILHLNDFRQFQAKVDRLSLSLYIHDVQGNLCIKVMIFNFSFSNIVIYISGFSMQHIGRDYVSKILEKLINSVLF